MFKGWLTLNIYCSLIYYLRWITIWFVVSIQAVRRLSLHFIPFYINERLCYLLKNVRMSIFYIINIIITSYIINILCMCSSVAASSYVKLCSLAIWLSTSTGEPLSIRLPEHRSLRPGKFILAGVLEDLLFTLEYIPPLLFNSVIC